MRTAGNKLYLEGVWKNKVGAKTPAGSILKGGDILKGNIKKIYTVRRLLKRQPKREMGLAGGRDLPYLEENHFLIVRLNERIRYLN